MIRIEGLKVVLGERLILDGVDLTVSAGETLALMGASGSGKSTLLRAAVGILKPESGRVNISGKPVQGTSRAKLRALRRKVGMLFQGNALFDSMTVAENIGFVLKEVKGMAAKQIESRVDELLVRLRLGPIHDKYPAELSGGMKKRVGIARAVAHDPEIVFYDDPTAGLDPITSNVIAELIVELGARGDRVAVIATNDLPLVMKAAHRVVLLHQGRIIELGAPKDMFECESPELKKFLESDVGE